MKISLNWLKEYVVFDWTPQQLAERLTMLGIEVEGIQQIGGDFPNVVIAQILASEKHPNADRLSVCRVTDGSGERQIVCGAKNYKVGNKVPLALAGANLPNGLTIKVGKIRGIESHGMMCSAAELKLATDAEGLLILDPNARVGAPLSEALGGSDTVLDLEITPNRPDLLSLIGIAREIAVLTGNSLQLPKIEELGNLDTGELSQFASVTVEDTDLCPRYTARIIRNIKVGPSPVWLKQKLERIGAHSINNVVDITNFVLYEIGQPLHAFDLAQLDGRKLIIRRARDGEKIITLDNEELKLDTEKLVIADASKPACLAGIIGGQNSGINEHTADILLESAYFNPRAIRAASKKLAVRSESSYRFERGADIGICNWASRRAVTLIADIAGGQIARGVIDTNPNPQLPTPIHCRYARINSRLGIEVPRETMKKIFTGLHLGVTNETADACDVQPPTFRVDLSSEADLSEEIGRIHGIEKIPAIPKPVLPAWSDADACYDVTMQIRNLLTGMGFWETISPILVAKSNDSTVALKNPLSEEMEALRGNLRRGLVNSLRINVNRGNGNLHLFEIGRVFTSTGEELHLALIITGLRAPAHWSETPKKSDHFDLKTVLEILAERTGADINATPLELIRDNDFRDPVFFSEFRLTLQKTAPNVFRELPKFPVVARDIAMVVSEETTHAQIVGAIRAAKPDWLENIEVFDIFRGAAIGIGKKSVAYRLTFRSADRTLTDAEVNKVHEKVKDALKKNLGCEVRE